MQDHEQQDTRLPPWFDPEWRAQQAQRKAERRARQVEAFARAKAEGREPVLFRRKDRLRAEAKRRRQHVVSRIFDGWTIEQIAAEQKVSTRRMNQLLDAWGVAFPRPYGRKALPTVFLAGARASWLVRLAKEAGVSPSEMAGRIISAMLEDPVQAKRMLGKLTLPVKRRNSSAPRSPSIS